jgi:hypothetical protein
MATMAWCQLHLAQLSAVLPCDVFRIIRRRASFHRCLRLRAVRTVRVVVIPRICSDWRDWRGCTGSSTAITSALSAEHSTAVFARELRTTRETRELARSEPCIHRNWRHITQPLAVMYYWAHMNEHWADMRTGVIAGLG